MISLSIMFHLASALGFLVLAILLAKSWVRINFMRRWLNPRRAGVLVGRPDDVLSTFCAAYGVAFESSIETKPSLAKVSLSSLVLLHMTRGIERVRLIPADRMKVYIKLQSVADWTEGDAKRLEKEFSDRVSIFIE